MSSILKALKKLEDDRSARRPDELKIDSEILRSDSSPRFTSTGAVLTALLLLAAGSGATYMFMARDKIPGSAEQKSPLKSNPYKAPESNSTAIKTEQLPPAVIVVPARHNNNASTTEAKERPHSPATTVAPASANKRPAKTVLNSNSAVPSKTLDSSLQTSPVRAVPQLRVNGIAIENGGTENVAMINGVPVVNGAIIEGVKVEEILKNRVRFSYKGEKFEIPLGQSNH